MDYGKISENHYFVIEDQSSDSEILIETVLGHLPKAKDYPYRILDLGTGTGCLLLTLLAVPVFYSYFDDIGNLKIFRGMTKGMEVVRRKTVETASSILGLVWKG